jgi:hypothetical protein
MKDIRPSLQRGARFNGAREFCEMIPGAVSLWSRDRSVWLLNESAKRMINYSEADFVNRPSLWLERVHSDDREKYCKFVEELDKDQPPAPCDYRFFPRNALRPKWIREQSVVLGRDQNGAALDVISAFTDISDVKPSHGAVAKKDDRDSAKLLIHELHNCFHKISMELELAQMDLKRNFKSADFGNVMDSLNRSLLDLRAQVFNILEGRTSQDPLIILDDVMRKMRKELSRQRVKLRLVRQGPLPMVEGDEDQLRNAFEQVFEFCGAMLKHGGDLEIEAGPKEIGGQSYAEVKVTSCSSTSLELGEEAKASQPEGHRIGLGIMLAAEILERYRGQVSFQQRSNKQGQVTVLIKASER